MNKIEKFWQDFLAACPDEAVEESHYIAESFGDNPRLADYLGQIILEGTKTATCSALWEWEVKGTPPPEVG